MQYAIRNTQHAIIADDLTGACDTALQFVTRGYQAVVAVGDELPAGTADVIALTTESRHCVPAVAYSRVSQTIAQIRAWGIEHIYKKVDSTLRGNVGRELDALLDTWPAATLLLAPAFPAQGRVVQAHQLFVHGQPLADTPFAGELPLRTSAVAALVQATAKSPVATVGLAEVRAGGDRLAQAIATVAAAGARIVVLDAVTDADLQTIAALLVQHPHWLGAGSAGLAAALAAVTLPPEIATRPAPVALPEPARPVLLVAGSRHPVTRAQLALVAAAGVTQVELTLPALNATTRAAEITRVVRQLQVPLAAGADAILTTRQQPAGQGAEGWEEPPAQTIAAALGEIVARLAPLTGALVLTGGDTAIAALQALQAEAADISGELQPGIPRLHLRGGLRPGMAVVTKAGGFGNPDTLREIRRIVRE